MNRVKVNQTSSELNLDLPAHLLSLSTINHLLTWQNSTCSSAAATQRHLEEKGSDGLHGVAFHPLLQLFYQSFHGVSAAGSDVGVSCWCKDLSELIDSRQPFSSLSVRARWAWCSSGFGWMQIVPDNDGREMFILQQLQSHIYSPCLLQSGPEQASTLIYQYALHTCAAHTLFPYR